MAMTSLAQNVKGETLATEKGTSLWADAYIRLKKNKLAMLGGIVVISDSYPLLHYRAHSCRFWHECQ